MRPGRKIAIGLLAVAASSGLVRAEVQDFESFSVNQSINGQGTWSVCDFWGNSAQLFDEKIVDDGTGNKVWRISNAYTSTSYSNQPFSARAPQIAGETGAQLYNDFGPDHTAPYSPPHSSGTAASNRLVTAFDFKSATGAGQANIAMTLSAGAAQSSLRLTYLQIADSGTGGFSIKFYDTTGSTFNGPTVVASGLSYSDWHHVEMQVDFVDGIGAGAAGSETGNDIVKIFVDNTLVHTGTTWESYYYNNADGGIAAPSSRAVDSLLFRQAGTATPANLGNGLYFDNFSIANQVPEPSSLGVLAIGSLAALRRRRRA